MKAFLIILLSISFAITSLAQQERSTTEKYRHGIVKGNKHYIPLKNTYTLISKDGDTTGPACLILQHNKIDKSLSFEPNLWVWLEMDGDNYFMTGAAGTGSGNPEQIDVFCKSTGANVFSTDAFILYADTLNNLIVFDDRIKNDGFFTLYNLNTNKYELYKEPKDNPCICCVCWDSVNITNSLLKITYKDTTEHERTVIYSRTIKK